MKDPLTGEKRPISDTAKRVVELELRHDIPKSDWAWGGSLYHDKYSQSYRLTEVGRMWEGPIWLGAFVEHKDVAGLTVRASVNNILERAQSLGPHRLRRLPHDQPDCLPRASQPLDRPDLQPLRSRQFLSQTLPVARLASINGHDRHPGPDYPSPAKPPRRRRAQAAQLAVRADAGMGYARPADGGGGRGRGGGVRRLRRERSEQRLAVASGCRLCSSLVRRFDGWQPRPLPPDRAPVVRLFHRP